jgi:hypothetical protein
MDRGAGESAPRWHADLAASFHQWTRWNCLAATLYTLIGISLDQWVLSSDADLWLVHMNAAFCVSPFMLLFVLSFVGRAKIVPATVTLAGTILVTVYMVYALWIVYRASLGFWVTGRIHLPPYWGELPLAYAGYIVWYFGGPLFLVAYILAWLLSIWVLKERNDGTRTPDGWSWTKSDRGRHEAGVYDRPPLS